LKTGDKNLITVFVQHPSDEVIVLLMLMRRATASVKFRTQVFLVYLQYISAQIHSKCASQPKIAKQIT